MAIALGCTLRHLAAKVTENKVRDEMSALYAPHQLGLVIKGGAEAVAHTARLCLHSSIGGGVIQLH